MEPVRLASSAAMEQVCSVAHVFYIDLCCGCDKVNLQEWSWARNISTAFASPRSQWPIDKARTQTLAAWTTRCKVRMSQRSHTKLTLAGTNELASLQRGACASSSWVRVEIHVCSTEPASVVIHELGKLTLLVGSAALSVQADHDVARLAHIAQNSH